MEIDMASQIQILVETVSVLFPALERHEFIPPTNYG